MNLIVTINSKSIYIEEIKYSIGLIFEEILGCPCVFNFSHNLKPEVLIEAGNSKILFNKFLFNNCIYSNGPEKFNLIEHNTSKLISDKSVLLKLEESILELQLDDNIDDAFITITNNKIETNVDFLGTTFFIASRFEEYLIKKRDKHGRFMYRDSILSKNNYILRPIINEYAFFLRELLRINDFKSFQKNEEKNYFEIIPTHDVDFPFLFYRNEIKKLIKETYGYYINSSKKESIKYLLLGVKTIFFKRKDPFDIHLELIKISNTFSRISTFNFMAGIERGGYNGYYMLTQKRIKKLIRTIVKSGHRIGFHPSYNTTTDFALFNKELLMLQKVSREISDSVRIIEGRQHYLKFDVNSTFKFWNDAGLQYDSTMGFPEHPGFRTGMCTTHSIFSLKDRNKIDLKERPLILMDVTITSPNYLNIDIDSAYKITEELKNTVKKYNGQFVVLFHNDWFVADSKKRFDFYKFVLS